MKIKYTCKNNRFCTEIELESVKDLFKKLAEFQEIFDEPYCGQCKGDNLQFMVRTVEGNDYYELKCNDCFAKLAYGQHKAGGGLFPKRKSSDGNFDKENKGWHKWKKE